MIPSRYLYPVIALVLLWAGSLFGVYQYATAEDGGAYQQYQFQVLQEMKARNDQYFEESYQDFQHLLEEDRKFQFQPILPVLENNRELTEEFRKMTKAQLKAESKLKFNRRKSLHLLRETHKHRLAVGQGILDNVITLLEEQGEQFDVSQDEVSDRSATYHGVLSVLEDQSILSTTPESFLEFSTRLTVLEAELELFHQQLGSDLIKLSGGIIISCFPAPYLPITYGGLPPARKGQPYELPISITQFSLDHRAEDLTIIIDGKHYPFDNWGYARYPAPTTKRGAHQIAVELQIRNPLTGEVRTSEAPVTYYVE